MNNPTQAYVDHDVVTDESMSLILCLVTAERMIQNIYLKTLDYGVKSNERFHCSKVALDDPERQNIMCLPIAKLLYRVAGSFLFAPGQAL